MIFKELENLAKEQRDKGFNDAYVRNVLKEYLQIYALYFIYTSAPYKQNLIFTGGTCLRHFYGLERLSEDIDMDHKADFSAQKLLEDLIGFFEKKYLYRDLKASLKQNESQILLKFPVLKKLNLASGNDSDFLYIKIDLSPLPSEHYSVLTTTKSSFGFNYAAKHYDLPSLMAGKLHAILTRRRLQGKENRSTIKGRDYFDLLWFVKAGVRPNLDRLSDLLAEDINLKTVEYRVDEKVADFMTKHKQDYKTDMAPLIRDTTLLETYTENYQDEYLRFKAQSFAESIKLSLVCRQCHKEFSSGIAMDRETFESLKSFNNTHQCPLCKQANAVKKMDYLIR